jgi:hypothetical protein
MIGPFFSVRRHSQHRENERRIPFPRQDSGADGGHGEIHL